MSCCHQLYHGCTSEQDRRFEFDDFAQRSKYVDLQPRNISRYARLAYAKVELLGTKFGMNESVISWRIVQRSECGWNEY